MMQMALLTGSALQEASNGGFDCGSDAANNVLSSLYVLFWIVSGKCCVEDAA